MNQTSGSLERKPDRWNVRRQAQKQHERERVRLEGLVQKARELQDPRYLGYLETLRVRVYDFNQVMMSL